MSSHQNIALELPPVVILILQFNWVSVADPGFPIEDANPLGGGRFQHTDKN